MAERELLVRIVGDDRDLQRALSNTERRVGQIDNRTATFGRNITRAFGAAGIAIGASEILRGAGAAVDAASAVNEEISKSRQIFGESSAAIEAWSTTTASAMGISQREALAATGTFGNLFRVVGIAPEQAGEMSRSFVQLAADLASFNNASPEDVLAAIRSGLIGEAEPLRRYGVLLSETRVQQVAMAETGKDNVKELTNQEKALARYKIILEDTAPAQGDFARTADSLANKQRVAAAETADLAATIGKGLAPAMELATIATIGLVGGLNDLIVGMGNLKIAIREGDFFEGFNEAVEDANKGVVDFFENIADGIPGMEEFLRLRGAVVGRADSGAADEGVQPGVGGGQRARARAERAREEEKAVTQATVEANRAQRRAQKAFDEFIKGQGLKLDKAQLTATLADDIAVLNAIEQAILRRIEEEGKTFELMDQLTQVRRERAALLDQQAADAKQAAEDAFAATMDVLSLNLEVAQATKSLADDQRALRAIEDAILVRIKEEGRTTELLRDLFNIRQEQAQVARDLAEQRRARREGEQFKALGLTEEGEERIGTRATLGRRANALEQLIKGTALDTEKNRQILDNVQKVLADKSKEVGRNVRAAIKQMLDDIASAFEEEDEGGRAGEFTRGGIRSIDKMIEGLGLTAEQAAELRRRNFGAARGGPSAFGFGLPQKLPGLGATGFAAGAAPTFTNEVRVFIGGQEVQNVITRENQKGGRRSAISRSGRAGGRPHGI